MVKEGLSYRFSEKLLMATHTIEAIRSKAVVILP